MKAQDQMKTHSGGIRDQILAKAVVEIETKKRNRAAWIASWPYRLHARAMLKNGRIGIVPRPRMMPAGQKCTRCAITKPAAEFYKNKRRVSLLRSECIPCHKERYAYTADLRTKQRLSRARVATEVRRGIGLDLWSGTQQEP